MIWNALELKFSYKITLAFKIEKKNNNNNNY